jgi:hypothetical protein
VTPAIFASTDGRDIDIDLSGRKCMLLLSVFELIQISGDNFES